MEASSFNNIGKLPLPGSFFPRYQGNTPALRKKVPIAALLIFTAFALFISTFQTAKAGLPSLGTINFTFTLSSPYTTSAGVYTQAGSLVRTLWSGVHYQAGTHTATWDGFDDYGVPAPAAQYQIRVLYHNIKYVWDGVIGNTSALFTSPIDVVHKSFNDIAGITSAGSNIFYCVSYNELQPGIREFSTTSIQKAPAVTVQDLETNFNYITSDGVKFYVATLGDTNFGSNSDFVTAYSATSNVEVPFTNGVNWTAPVSNQVYGGVIDLGTSIAGDNFVNAATGIAVQQSGNILAVAHGPSNTIRLFDKTTGASLGAISVTSPKSMTFDGNGNLWVITGTSVVQYTSVGSSNTKGLTLPNLVQPLGIASNKYGVLVADGGTSEQLKMYSLAGGAQWAYGLVGGYATNGPAIATNKFQFNISLNVPNVPLALLSDNSFWVGDAADHRLIHYDTNRNYIEQVAYLPCSYTSAVDVNNPTRVFSGYLEYAVNYGVNLLPGDPATTGGNGCWKLVNNWGEGLPANFSTGGASWSGFLYVATLSNNRTYGLITGWNPNGTAYVTVVELTSTGLRQTGITVPSGTMYEDGSIRYVSVTAGVQTIYKEPLVSFDSSGNPQWGPAVVMSSAPATLTTPVSYPGQWTGRSGLRFPVTSTGVIASYNTTCINDVSNFGVDTGMHVGGMGEGSTQWLWQASPAVTTDVPLVQDGRFDLGDGVTYAGNGVMTAGQNIICGYHGEFWNNGEANQFMHWWDDGLFVGQFGEPNLATYDPDVNAAGRAGNAFSPTLVTVNGEVYLYHNDESQHGGVHRWHLVGANTIAEQTASGALGATITLAPPTPPYPTQVIVSPGKNIAALSWGGVSGATYSVELATNKGGPYVVVANGLQTTSYTVTGLTDGQPYYFVVDANTSAGSGGSLETTTIPYDPTVPVLAVGQMIDGTLGHTIAGLPQTGSQATLTDLDYLNGNMSLYQVGSSGYELFDFNGYGANLTNLAGSMTVTIGSGWTNMNYITNIFSSNGIVEAAGPRGEALYSSPLGTINISPGDQNWHYLTVYSPAKSGNARLFAVALTPTGSSSPMANYTVNEAVGLNHVFQFLFQGNVTLTVNSNGGANGVLQALFFDNAPAPTVLVAPSGPTIVTPAAISSNPVSGTTATLTVTATDSAGPSGLTYAWAVVGTPPAPVTFSPNGLNAASTCIATFTKSGNYTVKVTVTDANNLTTTSAVSFVVNQTVASIAVSPETVTIAAGSTQQYAASANDQFGSPLNNQPPFTFSVNGGGTIDATAGLFTALSAGGPFTVNVAASGVGSIVGTAAVTVSANPTFVMNVTPSSETVLQGGLCSASLSLTDIGGYSSSVGVTIAGLPSGVTATSTTASISGNVVDVITFAATQTAAAGTYNVTITGADTKQSKIATVSITISNNIVVNAIKVSPGISNLLPNQALKLTATAYDQYGNTLAAQPIFTWSVLSGTGTVDQTGNFSGTATSGTTTVQAQTGTVTATSVLTVASAPAPPSGIALKAGLNFFSSPYTYGSESLDTIFGYTGATIALWSQANFSYFVTPQPQASTLGIGNGYWIRLPQDTVLPDTGTPATTTANCDIPLAAGWTSVGDPFLSTVPISSLLFDNGTETFGQATSGSSPLISPIFYAYDQATNAYVVATNLTPGQGYWVQAAVATDMQVPHP